LDPEAAEVEDDCVQNVHVRLAGVATAGADLPELERAAEQATRFGVESTGQLVGLAVEKQVVAPARREAIILAVVDRTVRASLRTFRAKQAASKVNLKRGLVGIDRVRGARLGTFTTASWTLRRIQDRQSSTPVGRRWRLIREWTRAMPLLVPSLQNFEHYVT
jgi:hypothetical protein